MSGFLRAISYYLPEKVFTNEEMNREIPEWNLTELAKTTGVYERHVAAEGEVSSDCAEKAALKLFSEHSLSPEDVDFILFCSFSPDYLFPATACILQRKLGIPRKSGALDYNIGCTGFVYGLMLANGLITSGNVKNVLLLTSDTVTKYIHPKDKGTRILFGDAASAAWISADQSDRMAGIGNFVFGTDGRGYDNIIIRNGGARYPEKSQAPDQADPYGNITNENRVLMNGTSVFLFSLNTAPKLIRDLLEKNNLTIGDIDLFIFHQASKVILDALVKKMQIPKEKHFSYLERVGNTISCTIPITLYHAIKERKISRGSKVVLASFGVGYSWAATIIHL